MKKIINWTLFFKLLSGCVITTLFVLPYTLAVSPSLAGLFTPVVIVAQVIQSAVIFSVAIFFGLLLSKKVGFELRVLEGKAPLSSLRPKVKLSIGLGVLSGVLIILFSFLFSDLSLSFMKAELGVAPWQGFLASFYGGFAEEILFRLFVMSFLVWLTAKFFKTPDGKPTSIGIWCAIVVSTLLFGLGHLGITSTITALTPLVVFRAILLNGVSILFGWLFWKKGLESAMIAHFTTDIIIHVITPFVARLIIGSTV